MPHLGQFFRSQHHSDLSSEIRPTSTKCVLWSRLCSCLPSDCCFSLVILRHLSVAQASCPCTHLLCLREPDSHCVYLLTVFLVMMKYLAYLVKRTFSIVTIVLWLLLHIFVYLFKTPPSIPKNPTSEILWLEWQSPQTLAVLTAGEDVGNGKWLDFSRKQISSFYKITSKHILSYDSAMPFPGICPKAMNLPSHKNHMWLLLEVLSTVTMEGKCPLTGQRVWTDLWCSCRTGSGEQNKPLKCTSACMSPRH